MLKFTGLLGVAGGAALLAGCVAVAPAPAPAPARPAPAYRPAPPAYVPPPQAGYRPTPALPPRGGRDGVVLFTQRDFRGAATPIDRVVPNLAGSGFDNHVSSVQVQGGRWELCSGPRFSGRCVVVTSSLRNLGVVGLNDQVSSVRRAP